MLTIDIKSIVEETSSFSVSPCKPSLCRLSISKGKLCSLPSKQSLLHTRTKTDQHRNYFRLDDKAPSRMFKAQRSSFGCGTKIESCFSNAENWHAFLSLLLLHLYTYIHTYVRMYIHIYVYTNTYTCILLPDTSIVISIFP